MGFQRVKQILDDSVNAWTAAAGQPPDFSLHGPSFNWSTKANLLAAVGHGFRLIQPEVIGNGNGASANLILDLRTGVGGNPQMPKDGPFIPDSQIQEIVDWINAGCPD